MHHRVTRTARARRRSGGQKRPSGAFLERGRVPDGAPEKAATNVAAFLLHHSLRDGFMLRLRLAFARGDWSLKMAAGLWAGAMIERERKRGANNVRRARRTTARAVLRSKMEALQADKRTGLNS